MKIFITGGTGFIGSALARRLAGEGHEVRILSRSAPRSGGWPDSIQFVQGDPTQAGAWQERVRDCEGVFNLVGAPVFHRWTPRYKALIRSSRIQSTARVVEAMTSSAGGPRWLISASAVGIYGFHEHETLAEDSAPGSDFLARVCVEWESAANEARAYGIRVIRARFGIVLGREGGALRAMLPAFRMGVGGRLGNGRQWFPWIHGDDVVHALRFLMMSPHAEGPFNLCAPGPVTNREFTRALGTALHRPTLMSAPGFLLRGLGGEFGENLLHGQRAMPVRLQEAGFVFQFPTLIGALRDVLPT